MLSERDDAHTMLTTVSGTRRPAPLGRAAHPNSKSEAYLHDLLSDVAGKELFRAGLKVNVRCQPGKRPLWTKDETIFVDPSLLNVLTRKEELAFVLAQQAVLLMAGADKNGVQFGADQMAVDLMIGAGLNPEGGYSALEKLYKEYPSDPEGEGLLKAAKSAASGAEHEGIRMSVAQLGLEGLRRRGEPALDRPLTPVPDDLRSDLVEGPKPDLRPVSGLKFTLERAFDRLEGKSHETRLDGVLETLIAASKNGALREEALGTENESRLKRVFSEGTGSVQATTGLHSRFLSTLMGSDSLRKLLNPLGEPWQDFLSNMVQKRGRFGLPEGLLVLNQMFRSGEHVDNPSELGKVREEVALSRLRPPYRQASELGGFLKELYVSQEWAPFSEEFQRTLPSLLLDVARTSALDPKFQHTLGAPGRLHPRMESDLVEMLEGKTLNSKDRDAVIDFLMLHQPSDRSWPTDRPSQRALKQILPRASRILAEGFSRPVFPDPRPEIARIYKLSPLQTATLANEDLAKLSKRIGDQEFDLKRESFPDQTSYRRAQRELKREKAQWKATLEFAAGRQSASVLVPLTAVGSDPDALRQFAGTVKPAGYQALLQDAEEALENARVLRTLGGAKSGREHVNTQAGLTMMTGWLQVQDQVKDLDAWYDLTRRTVEFCSPVLEMNGHRELLGRALERRLESLDPTQQQRWLRKPHVSHLLSQDRLEEILVGEVRPTEGTRNDLAERISKLDGEFELSTRRPQLFSALRDRISEKAKLQPQEIDSVFPKDVRSPVQVAESLAPIIKGLSGLLTLTREQPAKTQLDTIEYLMGQSKEFPAFLEQIDETQGFLPARAVISQVREELSQADRGKRLLVANAFLAGPSGLLRQEGGRETLLDHFLSGVREQERGLVSRMAVGILSAQGEADSLAVAALLSQKPGNGREVTEAEMLSSFFDAYGVPGIKMKQYFAFTTKAESHQEAFAGAQDNATPVSHYQALELLRDRFGGEWPEHLKVQGVLGNGSVNVAVKLFNDKTGRIEIASVNRRDIQEATEYDFERFTNLIKTLTKSPEGEEKFGFVLGLMKLVKDSVDLEFDREAALKLQKTAFKTYDHHYDGWHVRSIDAYRADHQSLFMEQAKGVTARKLKKSDPELYKQAMTAMHKAEMSILRGQPEQGDILPRALFANPDFHDGQVLVDPETKEVTILDFGQAIPITVEERKTALDLLTVFAKGDSAQAAVKRLNKRFFGKEKALRKADLEPVLEGKEMMGRFIQLLSLISRKGGKVPLSSVNWIMGINRQISLGKKLGLPVESQLKTMVASHKLGLGLGTANTLNAVARSLTRLGAALTGWCGAGVIF